MAPIVLITVKEPKRTKTDKNDETAEKDISTRQRFLLLAITFLMPGMFVLCLAGSIRNAGGYVWAYNTQVFFQKFYTRSEINRFMSWIPLVGGSLGAVVGGVISDFLVKNRGTAARIWVMVVSQVREGGREGGREGEKEREKEGEREEECDVYMFPFILFPAVGCRSICCWCSLPPLPVVLPLPHPLQRHR